MSDTDFGGDTTFDAVALDRFHQLDDVAVAARLRSCLAVASWIEVVAAGRPYRNAEVLLRTARKAALGLSAAELDAALARHPRIGERAGADHDADFSRREQSAVATADAHLQQSIRDGNLEYENKFGRVFLIRAAGRSPAEILAELHRRLAADPVAERAEVVGQLAEIALLRLEQLLQTMGER